MMTGEEYQVAFVIELERARRKHPDWPINPVMAVAVIVEEVGELVKDVNSYYWGHDMNTTTERIEKEAIQVGAMLLRFLLETPFMRGGPGREGAIPYDPGQHETKTEVEEIITRANQYQNK